MCLSHVAVSLRTIAMDTPKSFATLAGLKPALTAARTILAFAGGMSGIGLKDPLILYSAMLSKLFGMVQART
jgi:hypothetical protein